MRPTLIVAIAMAVAASPALAKDKSYKYGKPRGAQVAANCPPGLAKKNPPCVPPGQAKKLGLRRGDRFDGRYPILRDYGRYGLPRLDRGESYYRVGDTVIAVDNDTRIILDVISGLARLGN